MRAKRALQIKNSASEASASHYSVTIPFDLSGIVHKT